MSKAPPFVAAVVLNWNGWRDTVDCLESLLRLDYPADRLAIVLCDNGSTDDSVAQVRAWAAGDPVERNGIPAHLRQLVDPPVRKPVPLAVLDEQDAATQRVLPHGLTILALRENRGFAAGNNAALRMLFGQPHVDLVWLVNNDMLVDGASLRALVNAQAAQGDGTVFGGILLEYFEPGRVQEVGGGQFRMWQGLATPILSPRSLEGTSRRYVTGGFLFARRELLMRAGPMTEDYFMYCEDVDYSRRLERCGATLGVALDARAWHKGGGSSRYRSPRHDYYVVRNGLEVVRRFSPLTLPVAMVYMAFRCGLPKVWRREWLRLAAVGRAYADFLKGTMGPAAALPGE